MEDADEGRKTVQLDAPALDALKALPRDRLMLMMLTGPNPGAIQEVTGEIVLGRGIDLPARIDDRGMSRRHARVFKVGGTFYVEDLGSTNGTRLNGELVEGQRDLKDGDRIQLGETTLLRVSLQDQHEAHAARRLYQSAVLDPLTQVFNRGHFEERLKSEHAFSKRHKIPLTVLFFDLDKFKPINDTHATRPATRCCGSPPRRWPTPSAPRTSWRATAARSSSSSPGASTARAGF